MNEIAINSSSIIRDIVRFDYRTANIFKRYGIAYCCTGDISLGEACIRHNIDPDQLIIQLEKAKRNFYISNTLEFEKWKTGFLVDYIINVHHAYLKQSIPLLMSDLEYLCEEHKKQFPEFLKMLQVFDHLAEMKLRHIKYEEEIIFPYIRQIENTYSRKEVYGNLFVRTLRKPLDTIGAEHENISKVMAELRRISAGLLQTSNVCINHKVIYSRIQELDYDLVQHSYLENSILFPKAIEMERVLLQL